MAGVQEERRWWHRPRFFAGLGYDPATKLDQAIGFPLRPQVESVAPLLVLGASFVLLPPVLAAAFDVGTAFAGVVLLIVGGALLLGYAGSRLARISILFVVPADEIIVWRRDWFGARHVACRIRPLHGCVQFVAQTRVAQAVAPGEDIPRVGGSAKAVISAVVGDTEGTRTEVDILSVKAALGGVERMVAGPLADCVASLNRRLASSKDALPPAEHNSRSFALDRAPGQRENAVQADVAPGSVDGGVATEPAAGQGPTTDDSCAEEGKIRLEDAAGGEGGGEWGGGGEGGGEGGGTTASGGQDEAGEDALEDLFESGGGGGGGGGGSDGIGASGGGGGGDNDEDDFFKGAGSVAAPSVATVVDEGAAGALAGLGVFALRPGQATVAAAAAAGNDVLALGAEGTGKALACLLACAEALARAGAEGDDAAPRAGASAVVVAATRESARGAHAALTALLAPAGHSARLIVGSGAEGAADEGAAGQEGEGTATVMVGTPPRVAGALQAAEVGGGAAAVTCFVALDVDTCFEVGDGDALERIASALPAARLTLLSAAAGTSVVKAFAQRTLRDGGISVDV